MRTTEEDELMPSRESDFSAETNTAEAPGDLRVIVEVAFRKLVAACPPSTIVVAQVVLVEGATHVVVGVNRQVAEGGPSPDILKAKLAESVRDYLKLCPGVAWVEPSGEAPS